MTMQSPHTIYGEALTAIDGIEAELRRIGHWQEQPIDPAALEFRKAFAADTMAFSQWLQFVLVPRVRQIVAERGEFPSASQVGAQAVREYDGCHEAAALVRLLSRFDALFDGPVDESQFVAGATSSELNEHGSSSDAMPSTLRGHDRFNRREDRTSPDPPRPEIRGHVTQAQQRHVVVEALRAAGVDVMLTMSRVWADRALRLAIPPEGDRMEVSVADPVHALPRLHDACRRTSTALGRAGIAHRFELIDERGQLAATFEHPGGGTRT